MICNAVSTFDHNVALPTIVSRRTMFTSAMFTSAMFTSAMFTSITSYK